MPSGRCCGLPPCPGRDAAGNRCSCQERRPGGGSMQSIRQTFGTGVQDSERPGGRQSVLHKNVFWKHFQRHCCDEYKQREEGADNPALQDACQQAGGYRHPLGRRHRGCNRLQAGPDRRHHRQRILPGAAGEHRIPGACNLGCNRAQDHVRPGQA